MTETTHAAKIADLNDRFRTQGPASGIPGQIVLTRGIMDLPSRRLQQVLASVQTFNDFQAGDDPYGEHDFGGIDIDGVGMVFWKIDYYAPDMEHGSEDPADPSATVRVLTVMLASEY